MKKINKIFLSSLIGIIFVTLLVCAFLTKKENPVSAQEFPKLTLVCDEPIPTGEAFQETLSLMTAVYSELKDTRDNLTSAIEQLQSAVSELYGSPEEVCDFSVCQPLVIDQSPDLKLKVSKPWGGTETLVGVHIPLCIPKECIGEPCPDLEDYYDFIKAMKGGIDGSYEKIKEIFNTPSVSITEDIKKEGELLGNLITQPEAAKRKLQLAREWLHVTAEIGKRSCSLSYLERKKVEDGELGDRYPVRCTDALEIGVYWPRAWSEKCEEECKEGPTEDCKTCLAKGEGTSALAQINYRIYSTCGSVCKEELTQECIDCLCCKEFSVAVVGEITCKKSLSEKECTAWLCGGNYYNYVCCHEGPLEISEGILTPSTPQFPIELCLAADQITNLEQQKNDASVPLKNLLGCIAEKVALANEQGKCQWWITSISDSHGMDYCTPSYPSQCSINQTENCCYHVQNSCHYGGSKCQGKSYAFDLRLDSNKTYERVEEEALVCAEKGTEGVNQVCVLKEGDHYHISVNRKTCGCNESGGTCKSPK